MTGRKVVPNGVMEDAGAALRFGSATGEGRRPARGERSVGSAELFAGAKEVVIEHEGARYRLRCTSRGKLILTK